VRPPLNGKGVRRREVKKSQLRNQVALALLLFLAFAGRRADADAAAPSRCFAVERPEAPGKPYVFVAPGLVPHLAPSEVIELARGASDRAAVTCLELQPADPDAKAGWIQAEPWWAVHIEAPFSRIVSGAHGSCKAMHTMVFISDDTGNFVSSVGIDQKCSIQPWRLTKGR
jgi:hypothetical protein